MPRIHQNKKTKSGAVNAAAAASAAGADAVPSGSETETVRFDVGGTVYRVSRSLLERHPNTAMAKKAAEGLKEPIFVEGDREFFKYVLRYMRHGEARLPVEVYKKDLLHDMESYGFDVTEAAEKIT